MARRKVRKIRHNVRASRHEKTVVEHREAGQSTYGKEHLVPKVVSLIVQTTSEAKKSATKMIGAVIAALGHLFTEGDVNIPDLGFFEANKVNGRVKVTFTPAKKFEKCAEARLSNPQPAQTPSTEPEPASTPLPTPEPTPTPTPTPDPQPSPEPVPTPAPQPVPDPVPASDPTPSPEPQPAPEPAPAPDPQPVPDPVPASDPTPAAEPASEPELTPIPASNPTPDPQPAPEPQPAPASAPIPAPEPTPDPPPAPEPVPEDVARGKPIMAPFSANGYPIANVVDGNPDTKWVSGFGVPCWLNIKLGAVYRVKRIIVRAKEQLMMTYSIKGCILGHPIQTLIEAPNAMGLMMWDNLNFDVSVIEVWFQSSSDREKWVELTEIEVYGVPAQ